MNDVFTRIQAFNKGRDPYLIQLKYRAMQSDVFAFFRGTCHLFYQDWPSTSPLNAAPVTCICGDLHLQNLGSYKGDNRLVYFNINDFDEAALAPCTWDLARFLTCLLVAALDLGISEAKALALGKLFLKVYAKTLTRGRVRYLDNDDAVGPARALLFQVQKRARADFLDAHTQHADGARHLLVNGKQADPATAAERVKRGSTTISRALRWALASVTHLKPHGCASAALPPMITTRSVFLISVHEFVIAPRPNVGSRLATVGPCQTRA